MAPEQAMVRALLVRGMLVGLAAGLVSLVVAKVLGEPQVAAAIAFEGAHAAATAGAAVHEPEAFSRTVQSTIGLATGVCVLGVALGGIYSLVYAFAQGRLGGLSARATAGLLALVGFVTMVVVPFLKYPANPPATGNPETIGQRTVLYFGLLGASVLAAFVAVKIGLALAPRRGLWDATVIGSGVFVLAVGAVMLVLPGFDELPAEFPASVLWNFRIASLAGQFVTWATIGLLFGALTERSIRSAQVRAAIRELEPAF